MALTHVVPRDLPELRADLLNHYGSCFVQREGEEDLHGSVRDAELYFVTEPMCELAYQAARTLESFALRPHHLDSEHGLIWFDKPISPFGTYGFQFISWSVVESGVYCGLLMHRDKVLEWATENQESGDPDLRPTLKEVEDWPTQPGFYRIMWRRVLWGEHLGRGGEQPEIEELWFRFASALLLMRQPLASVSEAHAPRATQRRLARQDAPVGPVRVINLRSISGEVGNSDSQREWAHQWIVRGHWRMQPCGTKWSERRPTWIAPHIKGPEGAPLLGGEKIYAWTR